MELSAGVMLIFDEAASSGGRLAVGRGVGQESLGRRMLRSMWETYAAGARVRKRKVRKRELTANRFCANRFSAVSCTRSSEALARERRPIAPMNRAQLAVSNTTYYALRCSDVRDDGPRLSAKLFPIRYSENDFATSKITKSAVSARGKCSRSL